MKIKNPYEFTKTLHYVHPGTLTEILLEMTHREMKKLAKAHRIRPGKNRVATLVNILMRREKLRGYIKLVVSAP